MSGLLLTACGGGPAQDDAAAPAPAPSGSQPTSTASESAEPTQNVAPSEGTGTGGQFLPPGIFPSPPRTGEPEVSLPSVSPPLVGPPAGEPPPTQTPPETPLPETPTPAPPPPAPPPPASAPDPDLDAFLADCERGVSEWRAAQVDYPADLTVEVGESISYVAAVDARATPAGPGVLVPGPSVTGEAAAVRCEVAARLSPSGDGLTVDETDWVLRRFTPTGFIRWSWTVTAVEGGDQDLELELQPAIRTQDGTVLVSDSTLDVSTFVTRAHVDEDVIQQAGTWMDSHKGPLALIFGAVAAAAIAVVRFGRQFVTEMRQAVAAWTGHAPRPGGTPAGDDEELAPSAPDPQ